MKNKYFNKAKNELSKKYNVDVLDDIIIASTSKVILYGEVEQDMTLHVISGSLDFFGYEDTSSIQLSTILDSLDLNNKYAEVSGIDEYKETIKKDLFDFETETNITIPIQTNNVRKWIRIFMTTVESNSRLRSFSIMDVSMYRTGEEDIFEKTHKDSLTRLFNKYTLDYHYGARYKFDNFHVMYLDLDDFKKINDKCGHIVGNDFLKAFADILREHESNYNRFYRIGGDEFVGFLFMRESQIIEVATDILMKTTKYKHPDCKHSVSVSIGICKSTEGEDVIRKADKILYEVKENGKNHFRYALESQIKISK